jgi:hypothetical protein
MKTRQRKPQYDNIAALQTTTLMRLSKRLSVKLTPQPVSIRSAMLILLS